MNNGQLRAIRPDRSILLTASAGSGKTHVLVRRLIHLLACGIKPDSIAAITFTEKAAAEMKERLFKVLSDAAREGLTSCKLLGITPNNTAYPIVADPEDMLVELTRDPDALTISTIHSFGLKILRQAALDAGLPPEFSIMGDAEMPLRREEAVDNCIAFVERGELEAEFRTLIDAGYTLPKIKALLSESLTKRSQFARFGIELGGYDNLARKVRDEIDIEGLKGEAEDYFTRGIIKNLANALREEIADTRIEAKDDFAASLAALSRVGNLDEFSSRFDEFKPMFLTKDLEPRKSIPVTKGMVEDALKRHGLKGNELKSKKDELHASLTGQYLQLRDNWLRLAEIADSITSGEATLAFLPLYKKAETAYCAKNMIEGFIDYDDIEISAYRLLRGRTDILDRMERQTKHYLVDEFQDTSDIQWGVLERLNREVFSGIGVTGPGAPTLFAVGDRKQSIYRFRKANHALMGTLRTAMTERIEESSRDFPTLDRNFRSARELVGVVDEIFTKLMPDEYKKPAVMCDGAKGSVRLRITADNAGADAEALAEEIKACIGLPVFDKEQKILRPASYGDIAVLIRNRTRLNDYQRAMRESGIPFKITGGTGFFQQPEVEELLALLKWLEDPADRLSLAVCLKSPLFRMDDGRLQRLFTADSLMAALAGINPAAYSLFTRLRAMSGLFPLGEVVQEAVRATGALAIFGREFGPQAVLNIEKLVSVARDFDLRGGVGLNEFVEWVKACRDNADLSTADVELPHTRKFVSVMTVHSAKGLEFPVVVIPGFGRKPKNDPGELILGDGHTGAGTFSLGLKGLIGCGRQFGLMAKHEVDEGDAESARLLYVAMTRARDHLVMVSQEGPKQSGWMELLKINPSGKLLGAAGYSEERKLYDYPEARQGLMPEGPPENGLQPGLPDPAKLAPLPTPSGIMFRRASELASNLPEALSPDGASDPRLRGILVHLALEQYGKAGKYE
ncbi:MAG TPA: UvrD-helicase domain-containing protein, partial [Nitrospirota bacterium]